MFKDEFTIIAEDIVLHIKDGYVKILEKENNQLSPSRGIYKINEKGAVADGLYPDERLFSFGDIILELIDDCEYKVDVALKIRVMQLLNNYSLERRINYLIARNNKYPIEMEYELSDAEKQTMRR